MFLQELLLRQRTPAIPTHEIILLGTHHRPIEPKPAMLLVRVPVLPGAQPHLAVLATEIVPFDLLPIRPKVLLGVDAQILGETATVVHQQLLSAAHVPARPVIQLALVLEGHHVLLVHVPRAVHVPHPVRARLVGCVDLEISIKKNTYRSD